jgi:Spy/CpxP family protein refolding chaperone
MTHSGTRVIVLLVLTFAAGAAVGIAVDRHLLEPKGLTGAEVAERRTRGETTIERFADDLGLTEEQRASIRPILENARARMKAVFDEVRPEYEIVIDSARARIEAVLTPDQVARYRELLEQEYGPAEHD